MSNIIQVRHGTSVPGDNDLKDYELGYCINNGMLYIGKKDALTGIVKAVPVGGGASGGVPDGGTEGQVLTKSSNADLDTSWQTVPESLSNFDIENLLIY